MMKYRSSSLLLFSYHNKNNNCSSCHHPKNKTMIAIAIVLLLVTFQSVRGTFAVHYHRTWKENNHGGNPIRTTSTTTTPMTNQLTSIHNFFSIQPSNIIRLSKLSNNNKKNKNCYYKTLLAGPRGGSVAALLSSSSSTASVSNNDDSDNAGATLPIKVPSLPTLAQYRKFAVPCLALWVAGPLLSLVDTSFVGLSGDASQSAQQLAALGPATTFFDGATYLFAFLNVATTNLYSSARAQAGEKSDKAEAVVRTSARVAIRCGVGLMIFLFAFTRPLLKLYIGSKAMATPGLLQSACDYVYIRALSMPTSLLLGVLQASLLGAKDSVTPLIAILYSTIVNVIGDYMLVSYFNFGLQGAAIATTLAQWAGTAALIPASRRRLVRDGNLGFWKKGVQNEDSVSSRTFLSFAAPVLTLILGKLAAFGFMTHVAAAVPGQPTPLASHQIILSLLFFCSPFLEVLSQTAQTFLPPYLAPVKAYAKKMSKRNPDYDVTQDSKVEPWLQSAQRVATSLLAIGFVSAACIASIASLVPAFCGYFITSDTVIQNAIKPLAKYLWLGAFFWAPVAVSEGVLLARLELKFLASVYLLSTALLPTALMRLKYSPTGSVGKVWLCFVVFQIFRAATFVARIWGEFGIRKYQSIVRKSAKIASSANGGSQEPMNIEYVLPSSSTTLADDSESILEPSVVSASSDEDIDVAADTATKPQVNTTKV